MKYGEAFIEHKDTIIKNFSEAKVLENVLTEAQVQEILLFAFQNTNNLKWTATSSNLQPSVHILQLMKKCPWLKEIMQDAIGEFYDREHSGNYFITTQLHDAHADLITEEETQDEWTDSLVPYKSCVIPLIISARAVAHTAFFHQRHIGYSVTLDRAEISSQDDSMYEIAREYPDFYLQDGSISEFAEIEDHPEYIFPHIPPENNRGLSIENVFEFKPGNIMVFDACQIHASCVPRDRPNFRWMKSGINIQFYKKI